MIKLPFYTKPEYPIIPLAPNTTTHMIDIVNFLKWVVNAEQLEIANYLPEMEDDSFFLVAATGLGKTVGVPVHVLIRQIQRTGQNPNPQPRVWVIEPRIPIAVEQAEYMNHLWNEYRVKHSQSHSRTKPLFGCMTSARTMNRDAPIQFVTTGIFENLTRENRLDPVNDRVIIDEAHVTVEQNPGVELGIALSNKAGVTVDYMSATVDVTGLQEALGVQKIIRADKARNIIWKSNLLKSIDESIIELVHGTLVAPQSSSQYYPNSDYRHAQKVINSALEPGRSHGMLIVVNSFNGDTSDIRKLTNKLRKSHPQVPVLHLASDVVRDPKRQADFKNRLSTIERQHQNYIIMATSVVEMGITFPTLDYVVTMDAGYDQETIGDVSFPVVAPLGVNSLLQRIGRVGRRRPGIAYISNEVGADYSSLEDAQLNGGSGLAYEPIRYPLRSAPLMPLVYYAVQHDWTDLDRWLTELKLPSQIQQDQDRMEFFHEQLEKLELLGITSNRQLTQLGTLMSEWIGRADIAYATQLQKRFLEGASREEVIFWIVATALSNTSASSLKAQYGYFVDYDGSHKDIANRLDLWSGTTHEDVALFRAIAEISDLAPRYFWEAAARSDINDSSFYKWSNWVGIDARKFIKAGQAVIDTFKLFIKVNGTSTEFEQLFGKVKTIDTSKINWTDVYNKLPMEAIQKQLAGLAGSTQISLTLNEAISAFEWKDERHGHVGVIAQDDTPVWLDESIVYAARIIPNRETREDAASWRVTSLGMLYKRPVPVSVASQPTTYAPPPPNRPPTMPSQPPVQKKKGLLGWLLGR
jgi:hypothetical protein